MNPSSMFSAQLASVTVATVLEGDQTGSKVLNSTPRQSGTVAHSQTALLAE